MVIDVVHCVGGKEDRTREQTIAGPLHAQHHPKSQRSCLCPGHIEELRIGFPALSTFEQPLLQIGGQPADQCRTVRENLRSPQRVDRDPAQALIRREVELQAHFGVGVARDVPA